MPPTSAQTPPSDASTDRAASASSGRTRSGHCRHSPTLMRAETPPHGRLAQTAPHPQPGGWPSWPLAERCQRCRWPRRCQRCRMDQSHSDHHPHQTRASTPPSPLQATRHGQTVHIAGATCHMRRMVPHPACKCSAITASADEGVATELHSAVDRWRSLDQRVQCAFSQAWASTPHEFESTSSQGRTCLMSGGRGWSGAAA